MEEEKITRTEDVKETVAENADVKACYEKSESEEKEGGCCEHCECCTCGQEKEPEISDENPETKDGPDMTTEKDKYRAEVLDKIDYYEDHLEELKCTQEDVRSMMRMGVFDYDTAKTLTDIFNQDVDDLIAGKNTPGHYYNDPAARREGIITAIDMKLSLIDVKTDMDKLAQELSPEKMAEVYDAIYKVYKEIGSAVVLKSFAQYLGKRVKNEKERKFLIKELSNGTKMVKIVNLAKKEIFDHLYTNALQNFNVQKFIANVYLWNAERLKTITGKSLDKNEDWKNTYSDELLVFLTLFTRFIYKHYFKDFANNPLQRNLFREFIGKNAKLSEQSEEVRNAMNEAWDKVFEIICDVLPETVLAEKNIKKR